MALLFFFFFISLVSFSSSLILPVTKDAATLQYVTQIYYGTPFVPGKFVLDLGGPFLWLDCSSGRFSSSNRLIQCGSIECLTAKTSDCGHGSESDNETSRCRLSPENTVTGLAAPGELAEDMVAVEGSEMGSPFLFSCATKSLLKGLSRGTAGMLGLGRTRISLPSQLAGSVRKFAVCLSPSDGAVFLENEIAGTVLSKSLVYTPLLTDDALNSEQYFINVKSIRINGRRVSLGTINGGTGISTVVPYTTMERSIYETFSKAYIEAAASMNMTMAESAAPFGVCFRSESADPAVPAIDLVLQSEMVKWRIQGRNSMVRVSDEVICLGFLDGGVNPETSIILGGYQLEDNLLDFDLSTSMLGFSSSLPKNSCSELKLNSISRGSL